MGARSFDDEIAQVPSRDGADRYFAPNIDTSASYKCTLHHNYFVTLLCTVLRDNNAISIFFKPLPQVGSKLGMLNWNSLKILIFFHCTFSNH